MFLEKVVPVFDIVQEYWTEMPENTTKTSNLMPLGVNFSQNGWNLVAGQRSHDERNCGRPVCVCVRRWDAADVI